GIDSIALLQIRQVLEEEFRVTLELQELLDGGMTPRLLAKRLEQPGPSRPGRRRHRPEFSPVDVREPASKAALPPPPPPAALVEEVSRELSSSKALTQRYRSRLANNRAVAGLRPGWQELTFPIIADRAEGAHFWDADGRRHVDVCMGFGVHLFGHGP